MLKKLKVAHIITSLDSKGQVRVVQQIVNSFEEFKYEFNIDVDLFYIDNKQPELFFIKVPKHLNISTIKKLCSYDIIHSHNLRSDLIVLFLRFFGFLGRVKWVTSIHQHFFLDLKFKYSQLSFKRFFFGILYSLVLRRVDSAVVLSEAMKDYYLNLGFNCNYFVLFNALHNQDQNIYSSNYNKEIESIILAHKLNNKIVLGNACNVSRGKALDQVIPFLLKCPNCVYILIGVGPYLNDLKNSVHKNNLQDRFIFLGRVPEAKLYFKYFDFFLFTSYSEGFPISLLEAGYAKLPILCSSLVEINEYFKKNEIMYFNNDSTESLVTSFKDLTLFSNTFTDNMLNKLNKDYTLKIMISNYFNMYLKLNSYQ